MIKTPKYSDGRYVNGYTLSTATDISKTFRKERERLKAKEEHEQPSMQPQEEKVTAIRKRKP